MSVDGSAINSFNNLFSRFSRELVKDLSEKDLSNDLLYCDPRI